MYGKFLCLKLVQGEIGMQQMGLQARLMSQALRKMSGNASKAGCTLIFLNQIRYKVSLSLSLYNTVGLVLSSGLGYFWNLALLWV